MSQNHLLRVYLEAPMLATARAGSFNFMNQLKAAVEGAGWRLDWCETGVEARAKAPDLPGYALFHMEDPTHDRAMTFRRAYYYPFWQIEAQAKRWRFHVAEAQFDPKAVDPAKAANFLERLRERVLPPALKSFGQPGETVLVPLQGRIRKCRSFQSMSPVKMLETVAASGRPTVATLHPRETYDPADRAALAELTARFPNLRLGQNSQSELRDCAFVATQNSAVAFEGFLLGKPAVLFGQSDFHHITLNVADLGAEEALARAPTHRPAFEAYLFWFLRQQSVNATAPDIHDQIRTAMRRGGWPI